MPSLMTSVLLLSIFFCTPAQKVHASTTTTTTTTTTTSTTTTTTTTAAAAASVVAAAVDVGVLIPDWSRNQTFDLRFGLDLEGLLSTSRPRFLSRLRPEGHNYGLGRSRSHSLGLGFGLENLVWSWFRRFCLV